jgi:hypothetical protein
MAWLWGRLVGGDRGVGVDTDNEHARSRLRDEQRSVDHHRAVEVACVGQRGADRIEVLAAM